MDQSISDVSTQMTVLDHTERCGADPGGLRKMWALASWGILG